MVGLMPLTLQEEIIEINNQVNTYNGWADTFNPARRNYRN